MSSAESTSTTFAPEFVWDYFNECWIAQALIDPPPAGLLDAEVMIDGISKHVRDLTGDDLRRLAHVGRERIAEATLELLDRIEAEELRRAPA